MRGLEVCRFWLALPRYPGTMVGWGQARVAWCALAATVVLACGKTGTVGRTGSGGAAEGATLTGGTSAAGGTSATARAGGGGTGGATRTVRSVAMNPDLVAPTTVADLCQTFPAAWGDLMARCYGGEAADWAWLVHHACSETALAEKAGRIALNEANVAACFAVLAGGECLFGPGQFRPQCTDLVTGSVPVGQPCAFSGYGDECVSDAYCHSTGSICVGICAPRGIEGDGCHGLFVDVICASGLDCDGPSAVCKVPSAEGKPCAGELCQPGLYCDGAPKEGTCRPLESSGPCQSNSVCAPGFRCIETVGGAGACTQVKPTGTPCTLGRRECAGYCSPEGTCRVVAEEGESCGSAKDSTGTLSESIPCGTGLFCDRLSNATTDAICRRQLPLGSPWPETAASGNPCDDRDVSTYINPDTEVCAICD